MKYIIIISILLLSGCTTTRTVTMPDQSVYEIRAEKEDMVTFKKGDTEITVDGRPGPGMIEQLMAIMFMNMPDVEIGTD